MTDFSSQAVDAAIAEARPDLLPFQLQSDHIDKISAALSKAQAEMNDAVYNRENPHFRSRYADLSAVRYATMRCLTNHGISLTQQSTFIGKSFCLITQISLGDQWQRDIQPLPVILDKPQVMISFRTYARRAGWSSITGIAVAGEDDDGNSASKSSAEMILPSELDELMDIVEQHKVDSTAFCAFATKRLGYQIENLNMVRRADLGKVTTWLRSKKKEDAK